MDNSGVTSNFAFIIASGIMLASISSVYVATNDLGEAGSVRAGEQIVLQSQAQSLLSAIFSNGTVDVAGIETSWNVSHNNTDLLAQLGLLNDEQTQIAFDKLINLRQAKFAANGTDNKANYMEVAEDFNYTDLKLGFHIRAKPSLDTVDEILHGVAVKDQHLKISYIGNVSKTSVGGETDPGAGLVISNPTCELGPDGSSFWYNATITNGGNTSTQFLYLFDIYTDYQAGDDLQNEPKISRQGQTFLVESGASTVATALFTHGPGNAANRVDCDGSDHVIVEAWDTTNELRRTTLGVPVGTANATLATGDFFVEIDDQYYSPGSEVTIRYQGSAVDKKEDVNLQVWWENKPTGRDLVHAATEDDVPASSNQRLFTLDTNAPDDGGPDADLPLIPGNYTVRVEHLQSGLIAETNLLIAAAVGPYTPSGAGPTSNYTEDPALRGEVEMLDTVAQKFCPFYYDNPNLPLSSRPESQSWDRCSVTNVTGDGFKDVTNPDQNLGDVYPDLKDELEQLVTQMEWESNQTPRYDLVNTIVVGSNVAHNSMTSGNFKWPLQRWVEGGGTLIVFGSPAQSTNWLNPVFGIKETTSSGGLSAPDTDHPLLNVPEQLAWDQYDSNGYGWEVTSAADDAFTAVVKEGDTPVTVISDPGAFGNGTIVLTTWLPYDITGNGDPDQGLKMLNNFLMQGYRDLFLDYGPELPAGVPVIPALGFAQVQHPNLDDPVALRITIYVFPYSY